MMRVERNATLYAPRENDDEPRPKANGPPAESGRDRGADDHLSSPVSPQPAAKPSEPPADIGDEEHLFSYADSALGTTLISAEQRAPVLDLIHGAVPPYNQREVRAGLCLPMVKMMTWLILRLPEEQRFARFAEVIRSAFESARHDEPVGEHALNLVREGMPEDGVEAVHSSLALIARLSPKTYLTVTGQLARIRFASEGQAVQTPEHFGDVVLTWPPEGYVGSRDVDAAAISKTVTLAAALVNAADPFSLAQKMDELARAQLTLSNRPGLDSPDPYGLRLPLVTRKGLLPMTRGDALVSVSAWTREARFYADAFGRPEIFVDPAYDVCLASANQCWNLVTELQPRLDEAFAGHPAMKPVLGWLHEQQLDTELELMHRRVL